MQAQSAKAKRGFVAAVIGTVLVALCCFTPLLVVVLGAIGLSAFTSYLDYALLPALAVMIVMTVVSYLKWRRVT
jgi:mercuric ion transport protein